MADLAAPAAFRIASLPYVSCRRIVFGRVFSKLDFQRLSSFGHATARKHVGEQEIVTGLSLTLLGEAWSFGIELARLFPDAMRNQNGEQSDSWLQRALQKDAPREIRRFAHGLCRDLDAVRMAFTSLWSNGQTEGHVNRLKMIKRQIYGRAGFDLLRIRFLHAA